MALRASRRNLATTKARVIELEALPPSAATTVGWFPTAVTNLTTDLAKEFTLGLEAERSVGHDRRCAVVAEQASRTHEAGAAHMQDQLNHATAVPVGAVRLNVVQCTATSCEAIWLV